MGGRDVVYAAAAAIEHVVTLCGRCHERAGVATRFIWLRVLCDFGTGQGSQARRREGLCEIEQLVERLIPEGQSP